MAPISSMNYCDHHRDMPLARRETSAGLYSPMAFYISKIVANLPFFLLQIVVVVACMFSTTNLGEFRHSSQVLNHPPKAT